MAKAALAQTCGAADRGDHCAGGETALRGGGQRAVQPLHGIARRLGGACGRAPGVHHGLVARPGLATLGDALGKGRDQIGQAFGRNGMFAGKMLGRTLKGAGIKRAGRGPHRVQKRAPGDGEKLVRRHVLPGGLGARAHDGCKPLGHGVAMIGIADGAVQRP